MTEALLTVGQIACFLALIFLQWNSIDLLKKRVARLERERAPELLHRHIQDHVKAWSEETNK